MHLLNVLLVLMFTLTSPFSLALHLLPVICIPVHSNNSQGTYGNNGDNIPPFLFLHADPHICEVFTQLCVISAIVDCKQVPVCVLIRSNIGSM